MWRIVFLAFLVVTSANAEGVLLGKSLVGKDSTRAQVHDAGGEPDQIDRIDGDESSPAMEIWTYRRGEKGS